MVADIGKKGEELAEKYLRKKGFAPLERRFKTPRWGEIDLVMRDGDTTVFVEVKTRSGEEGLFGGPLGAITRRKLYALQRAAQYYLGLQGHKTGAARIDAVAVILRGDENTEIRYYPNITS